MVDAKSVVKLIKMLRDCGVYDALKMAERNDIEEVLKLVAMVAVFGSTVTMLNSDIDCPTTMPAGNVNLMPMWQRKPTAKALGQRLNLTNPDRERLRLWTIAPSDMGEQGMLWWRKQKAKKRMARLRRLRGSKPRANSISRTKPWTQLGISRAGWYRLRETVACSETTSCAAKLVCTENELVSLQKRRVSEEGVAAKRTSPKSIEHLVQAQKTEEPVMDTARELCERNCLNQAAQNGNDLRGMPADLSKFYPATRTDVDAPRED